MKKLIRSILVLTAMVLGVVWMTPASELPPQSSQLAQRSPGYLGVQACAECHADMVERQRKTVMATALEPINNCQILSANPKLKFQQGRFNYQIERKGNQSIYTVTEGQAVVSAPILFCFGQGKSGQTYVYELGGVKHESRVSFYNAINGLDITLGHSPEAPKTLVEAAGRAMSVDEEKNCFFCHSTGANIAQRVQLEKTTPGINCEACHGSGEKHVAAMRAGEKAGENAGTGMKKLGALDGDDITQNVCGKCHRSVDDVIEMPNRAGINNVRFQPYRIFHSRCYSADRRIGCTACHDPHGDLEVSPAFYDAKCLACHTTKTEKATAATTERSARACPTGKNKCTDCHMPKIDLPGAHFKFTDHRIRIVREGAPYPN
ncbi:MAG: multiheme c-type cytochrome [Acidobacteriota bacterium]